MLISQLYSAGIRAEWSEVRVPIGAGNFSSHHHVQTGSVATQPPIQWILRILSLGVKQPWREADHSPPSSTEVMKAWSYTSIPTIHLHGVVLRAQEKLYLFHLLYYKYDDKW